MDYSEENKNYLCKLIEKGLAENSMLANVAASSEAKNLEERKAYSLKVDRIDIKEIMSKVFENTYRNFISITEKYTAEIYIKNKDISNFILGTSESEKIFKVPQGKIFKVRFNSKGFNGIIEFMKKKITDENNNAIIEVIFDEGEYKILLKETFENFRNILVYPINYYISKSIYTTAKNIKRDKARKKAQNKKLQEGILSKHLEQGEGILQKSKGVFKEEISSSSLSPEQILEKSENELHEEFSNKEKDIRIKEIMERLKDYITTKMKPKRARIYQLYLQYKMNKSFITKEIPATVKEIAKLVGESEGNVKVNFNRANKEIIENFQSNDLKVIFNKENR